VLFADASEVVYKQQGLASFQQLEDSSRDQPMADGPYAQFLRKLARLQERLPFAVEQSPVRLAIVTARSAPAELRVIHTLRHWGVTVNETFFLGGVPKTRILQAFRPHIFFDDQDAHLEPAHGSVPAGRVPYRSDSVLHPENQKQP
jgi:5'-nucleotidase